MKLLAVYLGGAVGFAFLCGGLWIFAWDIDQIQRAGDSRDWPQADGIVDVSAMELHGKENWPHVEYSYSVAGVRYTSHQISFDLFKRPGGQGSAESIVYRYPVGSEAAVYYHPDNPALAILGGILYLIALAAAWIAFTAILGI